MDYESTALTAELRARERKDEQLYSTPRKFAFINQNPSFNWAGVRSNAEHRKIALDSFSARRGYVHASCFGAGT